MVEEDCKLDGRRFAVGIAHYCRVGAVAAVPYSVGCGGSAAPGKSVVVAARDRIDAKQIDLVTFASPSAVRHFAALFPEETMRAIECRTAFAAIGPVTASALQSAGMPARVVAEHSTMEALLEAIIRYFQTARVQP